MEAGAINHLFSCKKIAIDVAHRPPAVVGLAALNYTGAMVSADEREARSIRSRASLHFELRIYR